MDDRLRTSDADRDRVAALLRDHFAEGRLTRDELDERVTATLSATTFGDLRRVLADLPAAVPALPPASPPPPLPPQAARSWRPARRRPRVLPLALLLVALFVVLHGAGWIFLAFFQAFLLFWLVVALAGIFAAARFRRRLRGGWWDGQHHDHHQGWPGGHPRQHYQ
jgi:hypothetical protein